MQYHSPITPPSSSRYTCPPHSLKPKAPVFAFNTGLYDLGPNEIDPLDLSCLPDDRSAKTDTPGDFTSPSQSSANIWIPFERQRYSSASYSSIHTPPLSDYTEMPSTLGSTPSPVLLRTPRSRHHDLRRLDPLLDKRTRERITGLVSSTDRFFQNALPLTCTEGFSRKTKTM